MGNAMDDIQIVDPFDDRDDQGVGRRKSKKGKDDNDKDCTKGSKTLYEGCMVERLEALPGEKKSWRRCGRRWLPLPQEQLVSLVKKNRKERGIKTADADFKRLGPDKQGIINRIIDEKKLNEKSKTAEWTLVDVQSVERRVGFTSKEIVRLQIVIKRVDKGSGKDSYGATGGHSYSTEDVIDLSLPLKKKDKSKDKNKDKGRRDDYDPLDDPMNMGFGPNDLPPRRDDHYHDQPYQDHGPHYDQQPNHPPPPAPFAPDWRDQQQQPNPFDPHAQFGVDPRASFPGGAREFTNPNPFYPQHHVAAPGQYDEPLDNRDYIHPHQGARARTRSAGRDRERSRSQRRLQSSARRPSRSRPRRDSRYREDSVEDMGHKFDRMYRDDRDSNSSNYDDGRSIWSRSDGRYDRSPDTSVYSDDYPSRNRSKPYHRDSDPRPRYRSSRYHDTEVEPGYNYRQNNRDRRYSRDIDRDRRPGLPHAITYDDYPSGRGAEPRYLPAPPVPRRNTEIFGDKRNDYFDRQDRDWRNPMDRDPDAFEAGMRAARRQSTYYP